MNSLANLVELLLGAEIVVFVREGKGAFETHRFSGSEITVGRVRGNDLVLPKGNVSKRHLRVVRKDDRIVVVDLKSTCGFFVNGRRTTAPTVVRPSDKVYLGDFTLQFVAGLPALPETPAVGRGDLDRLRKLLDSDGADLAVATELLHEGLRRGDPALSLMAMATAPPSAAAWERFVLACRAVHAQTHTLPLALAGEVLDRFWPDALRLAPSIWLDRDGAQRDAVPWSQVRALDVSPASAHTQQRRQAAWPAADDPLWSQLRVVTLRGPIEPWLRQRLAAAPLRALHVADGALSDDLMDLVLDRLDRGALRSLTLRDVGLTEDDVERLCASDGLASLRQLDLGGNALLSHEALDRLLAGARAVIDWTVPWTMLPSSRTWQTLETLAARQARLHVAPSDWEARQWPTTRAERVFSIDISPLHPMPLTSGLRTVRVPLAATGPRTGHLAPLRFDVRPAPVLRYAGGEAELEAAGLDAFDRHRLRNLALGHGESMQLVADGRTLTLTPSVAPDFLAFQGVPGAPELPPTRGVFVAGVEQFPDDARDALPPDARSVVVARRGHAPVRVPVHERVRIGLHPSNDLVLVADGVAPFHAELFWLTDGTCQVRSCLDPAARDAREAALDIPVRPPVASSTPRLSSTLTDLAAEPRCLIDGEHVAPDTTRELGADETLAIGRFLLRRGDVG